MNHTSQIGWKQKVSCALRYLTFFAQNACQALNMNFNWKAWRCLECFQLCSSSGIKLVTISRCCLLSNGFSSTVLDTVRSWSEAPSTTFSRSDTSTEFRCLTTPLSTERILLRRTRTLQFIKLYCMKIKKLTGLFIDGCQPCRTTGKGRWRNLRVQGLHARAEFSRCSVRAFWDVKNGQLNFFGDITNMTFTLRQRAWSKL